MVRLVRLQGLLVRKPLLLFKRAELWYLDSKSDYPIINSTSDSVRNGSDLARPIL